MPSDTRQEILYTAKRLFNERGYNDVTTRDIADALSISKGNLTYYFKKKLDIIEALVTENTGYQAQRPPETIAELNDYLSHFQDIVQDNAFYFWHYAQLSQLSPKIHDLQTNMFSMNVTTLHESFGLLARLGLMRQEEYLGEYLCVVNTILITGVYWIPFCKLQEAASYEGFLKQAWSVAYPLLTKKGKAAYTNIPHA